MASESGIQNLRGKKWENRFQKKFKKKLEKKSWDFKMWTEINFGDNLINCVHN